MLIDQDFRDRCEQAFRSLLGRVRTKPFAAQVQALVEHVAAEIRLGRPPEETLVEIYRHARREVIAQLLGQGGARRERMLETTIPHTPPPLGYDFHCDAGLGGLARWLRAAGYDAAFWPGIDDDDLLRKMPASSAVLLTSDRRLTERGVITSGAVAAILVPISLKKRDQFAFVRCQLELALKPVRCMACGGRLIAVEKESVRERIPPRTYPWLDDYYECQRCQRLFWQGTHWRRIQAALEASG